MLVFSQETLSPSMVRKVKELKGVTDVEQLSLGQVSLENRTYTIAAVDPSSYRNYTPVESAQLQEAWERVAAGQLALVPSLKKKVPSEEGALQLGNSAAAPVVHIGAYAPQIPTVDAVVNSALGTELGMRDGNALIVTTGLTAPAKVRPMIEKIVGSHASVQSMDAVARYGLDIDVQQTAYLVGSVGDAVGVFNYTVLGGGRIAPDASWVSSHIATATVPILGQITCNRLMIPQLRAALQEIEQRGLAGEIHPDEYAGCYYPRFIAGTTTLSNHSFGLALDLNVPGNLRGTVGEMDRTVVSIFQRWGFTWGGDWGYTDPMHFEMNALVEPR